MNWFLSDFNYRAWRLIRSYRLEGAPEVTLFYGGKGLGKSALLQDLHQRRGRMESEILIDALTFARQYAYAAQNQRLRSFRKRYRSARLLMIDNLHYLAGKAKTIEELEHTYEYIVANGGKIVSALEAGSLQLEFLGERLASRFLSGVAIPLTPPLPSEIERFSVEYIQQKQLMTAKEIPGLVAEGADNLTAAAATIDQFVAFAELKKMDLNLSCFYEFYQARKNRDNRAPEPENIIRIVAQVMEVSSEELAGPSRKPNLIEGREMAVYVIRTLCRSSYSAIGGYFQRSHAGIIASYKKMQEKLMSDQRLAEKYHRILEFLEVGEV